MAVRKKTVSRFEPRLRTAETAVPAARFWRAAVPAVSRLSAIFDKLLFSLFIFYFYWLFSMNFNSNFRFHYLFWILLIGLLVEPENWVIFLSFYIFNDWKFNLEQSFLIRLARNAIIPSITSHTFRALRASHFEHYEPNIASITSRSFRALRAKHFEHYEPHISLFMNVLCLARNVWLVMLEMTGS